MFDIGQHTATRTYGSMADLNSDLQRLTGAGPIPRSERAQPRAKAQRLVYDAWRADGEAGIPLARRALTVDPDVPSRPTLPAGSRLSRPVPLEHGGQAGCR